MLRSKLPPRLLVGKATGSKEDVMQLGQSVGAAAGKDRYLMNKENAGVVRRPKGPASTPLGESRRLLASAYPATSNSVT